MAVPGHYGPNPIVSTVLRVCFGLVIGLQAAAAAAACALSLPTSPPMGLFVTRPVPPPCPGAEGTDNGPLVFEGDERFGPRFFGRGGSALKNLKPPCPRPERCGPMPGGRSLAATMGGRGLDFRPRAAPNH